MARLIRLTPMLQTTDFPATIAFYSEVLGFALVGRWPDEAPQWCMLSRGDVRVMFMTNEHCGPPSLSGTLYIETDDVLAIHQSLEGRVEILWGPEVYHYGMLEFAIKDPNGYTISFGQAVEPQGQ
jgi:catechol 2,3-dioxygenase-like lactoylglutathione lyase family enzyme